MANPWNSWVRDPSDGRKLKAAAFDVPGKGPHFLALRGQLFDAGRQPEGMPGSVRGLQGYLAGDLSPLDALGPGMAAATELLAADSRLRLDCVVALLGASTALAKRNRAQALREFPLLVRFLTMQKQPTARLKFLPDEIADTVDEGRPLVGALAELFRVPPWTIRHLRRLSEEDVAPYTSMRQLALHLSILIPERAPAKHGYALLTYLFGSELDHYPWIAMAARRSVMQAGWPELGTRVARIAQFVDYAGFVHSLVRLRGDAIDAALGQPTLAQIERLSDRWHEIEARIRNEHAPPVSTRDPAADSWPPLLAQPKQFGDYELRSLCDRAALEAESQALSHCVAGYADRCAAGWSHIVSISWRGSKVATAELRLVGADSKRTLEVQQVSGHRNAPAEPGAVRAIELAIEGVQPGVLAAMPVPDESFLARDDRAAGWLFQQTYERLGQRVLALYRPCLQLSSSKSGLWDEVSRRYRP
jgi:hypothetical protein